MTDGKYEDDKIECDDTKDSLFCESVVQYSQHSRTDKHLLEQSQQSTGNQQNRALGEQQIKQNLGSIIDRKSEQGSDPKTEGEEQSSGQESEESEEESEEEDDEQKGNPPFGRQTRSLSLSEGYAHLYLFHLPQQLTSAIMSSLSNLLNQFEISTILQNIVNNTIFRRRSSTPSTDGAKVIADNQSTSYGYNTLKSKALARLLNDNTTIRTLKSSELIELDCIGGVVELDNSEKGVGHDFENYKNDKPTWCDACADYLSPPVMNGDTDNKSDNIDNGDNSSGSDDQARSSKATNSLSTAAPVAVQTDKLMRIYIQCRKCNYVCHLKCYSMIRLDCRPQISIDQEDPSTRLRTRKSKAKNNRHRNSVRFDGQLFPDSVMDGQPQVDSIQEIIDNNNNCNNNDNDPTDNPTDNAGTSRDSISETLEPASSSTLPNDNDETTINSSFDDSSTSCDLSTSSSSYQNDNPTTNSNDTLSESVFQSDIDASVTSEQISECEPVSSNNHNSNNENNISNSNNKQQVASTTYTATAELLVPSLIVNLKEKILKYNERIRSKGSGLGITLIDEPTQLFRGFLRVYMNLTRPINVVAGKRPPSIYDIINEQEENAQANQQRKTLTSFYMPRDTVKNIHITSENSTLHVIKEMLKKFKVVDNPQKFALYLRRRFPDEETLKTTTALKADTNYEKAIYEFLNSSSSQSSLKRLHDLEKPLILQLEFGSFAPDCVDIVLQENDNADICWDAFEIPELKNFLKILDREESEHLSHVRAHYMDKKRLIAAMIDREESKLRSVNITHPNSPERFNGKGPPPGPSNGPSNHGNSPTTVITN